MELMQTPALQLDKIPIKRTSPSKCSIVEQQDFQLWPPFQTTAAPLCLK